MQKNFVVDTNVFVHDYNSFYNVLNSENKIFIPLIVLEELDKLKTKLDDVGVNARNVIRCIERELINENPNVEIVTTTFNETVKPDNQILGVCLDLLNKDLNPILISKDVCLRTKARSQGIHVEDYKKDSVNSDNLYTGYRSEYVSNDVIQEVFRTKFLRTDKKYFENEAVILEDECNPKNKAITIYSGGELKLINNKIEAFGLPAANLEQIIALNHLLNPDIKLVTLSGGAGTGKTLLAVASALELVLEQELYNKFTVARPIMAFQKDIGFLPGDIEEKLGPWMMPIVDNLDFLFSFADQPTNKRRAKMTAFEELKEQGVVDITPLTYIRGRSIPKQYIIIDETQQCTPDEMRTILTRVGKDTKIVLTGCPDQIDNPFLSADTNGLSFTVDRFKNSTLSAHVTFTKCERSELSEEADKLLR